MQRIKEKRTIIFKLIPAILITIKDISIERGIAIATKQAVRMPKKKSNTPITNKKPDTILFSKVETIFITLELWSLVISIKVPFR